MPDWTATIEIDGDPPSSCDEEGEPVIPCDHECELLCHEDCGGVPCLPGCEGSPWWHLCDDGEGGDPGDPCWPDDDEETDPLLFCLNEVIEDGVPFCASCPPECEDCEPNQWQWSAAPVEAVEWRYEGQWHASPPDDGSTCVTVRFLEPGEYGVAAESDCCGWGEGVVVVELRLDSVTFGGAPILGGYHPVAQDSNGQPYETPHWQLLGDADACTSDPFCCNTSWDALCEQYEQRHPVAYTSGTHAMVEEIVFQAGVNGFSPGEITIKGISNGTVLFEGPGAVQGETIVAQHLTAANPVDNTIAYYEAATIDWVLEFDGATLPCGQGTSTNTLYVTWGNPLPGVTLYHTVIDIACREANGMGIPYSEAAVVEAIFDRFRTLVVQNHENQPPEGFGYWRSPAGGCVDTQCLITGFDGQCGAWAYFMRDVVKVHGIPALWIPIFPDETAPGVPAGLEPHGLWVKKWDFSVTPPDPDPVAGQGGIPTHSLFNDHAVVIVGGLIYDPSYGTSPFADLLTWQRDSLSAVSFSIPGSDDGLIFENPGDGTWPHFVRFGIGEP